MNCCPRQDGSRCEIAVNKYTTVICEFHQTQPTTGYWELYKATGRADGPSITVTVEPPYESTIPEIWPSMDDWTVTRWTRPRTNNESNRPLMWIADDLTDAMAMAVGIAADHKLPPRGVRLRPSHSAEEVPA